MSVGFQSASKRYDMLDAEGLMEYKNRAYAAAGKQLTEDFATPEKREAIYLSWKRMEDVKVQIQTTGYLITI
ncbi:hypothetical protein SAMN05444001_10543 [Parabacteroides chinchillae]|uniref:Uncharacterized protein n=1 Tax=Parabacteroides chinchillae TaxID=871327 RepID=A0A8G2FA57_9BACT|nr:hypothetical protein [Parabacteroides chinchillae]SEF70353.1 hypothetical protein SAMN05444001_10543 [Parabacteroides chinchillae]